MSDLPDPMTPADCDLRGYEWMPLFGARLFTSHFEAHASDLAFRIAIRLYWECWLQVPAASLPNDDVMLCRLAGLGRDMKTWRKLRAEGVLHGFIRCSDDRLYHALIAEQAIKACECRRKKEAAREQTAERVRQFRSRRTNNEREEVTRYKPPSNPLRNAAGNAPVTGDVTSRAKDSSTRQVDPEKEVSQKSSENASFQGNGGGAREKPAASDGLGDVFRDAGIQQPKPGNGLINPDEPTDCVSEVEEPTVGSGAVMAQVRRVAKARRNLAIAQEVKRSPTVQADAVLPHPEVVERDGYRWAPAAATRSPAEMMAELLGIPIEDARLRLPEEFRA